MKKFKRVGLPGAMVLGVLAASPCRPAHAADLTWNGALSTIWDDEFGSLVVITNWFPGSVAGAGDNALFGGAASTTTVNLNGNRTVSSVSFEGADNYSLAGPTLTLQTGDLTATGGASHTIASQVLLGENGTWDVGAGTTVNVTRPISGGSASNILNKIGDGTLSLSGNNLFGRINVFDGWLRVSSDLNLGPVGVRLALADGAGLSNTGSTNFASTRTMTLFAGQSAVEVLGTGSVASWAGEINGAGGLEVVGDGTFAITSATDNTNQGVSTVAGGNLSLQTPAGVTALGGDLEVSLAGRLDFTADHQTTGDTNLTIANATADLNGTTQRFNKVAFTLPGLLLMTDATFYADTLQGASNRFGIGSDATVSARQVIGTLSQDTSTFSPGDGIGSAVITGDYSIARGTVLIELNGTTPGTGHDHIDVQGTLDLQAISIASPTVLDVQLGESFNPAAGDRFDIFDFGSLNGTFDTINLPTLASGLAWDDSQLYIDGSLSVLLDLILGDMNGDGSLTNGDIAPFVLALTDPSGYATQFPDIDPDLVGDFDGGGSFTNGDIAGFVDALTGGGSLAAAQQAQLAAVPEPTSLALLGLGGLMIARRRRG